MEKLCDKIIHAIQKTISNSNKKELNIHEPVFKGNEKKYLLDCIDKGYVSSIGEYINEFEKRMSKFTGAKYGIAVMNGTAALHVCLKLAEVRANDEVLVPSLTFVATSNAIRYCQAFPHYVESDEKNLGIDTKKLEDYLKENTLIKQKICINKKTGRPIRAIIVVHVFGMPTDLDPLQRLCKKYHLKLIEDAAESLGSYYKKKHTGTFGMASALSFNGNKILTTGGGGMVLCNKKKIYELAKHITTTAKISSGWRFSHDKIGFNYRMPNLNAALGCAQIEQLALLIKKKRKLAKKYRANFAKINQVKFLNEPDYAKSNFWLNTIILDKPNNNLLKNLIKKAEKLKIQIRPAWKLSHTLPMYKDCPSMNLDTTEKIALRIMNLPSSADLLDKHI